MFNLKRNSAFAGFEVVVNGLALFFIYRNVVQELGVSMLGIWSLVLATTAFGRAADVGITSGLSRFVARSLGNEEPAQAILYMRTGFVAVAIFMGGVALILWYPLWYALAIALDGTELVLARQLLPWAILSFWLLNLKSVMDACLLGVHRADLRAISNMIGMIFQLAASLALVSGFGLFGLAWAQAAQFLLAFIMSLGFLVTFARIRRREDSVSGWFCAGKFKEMLGFGVKLQIGTIANLMFEPVVKIVLGAVAGTAMLGIFEMAYRMAYQVRNVAILAIQTTVPAFTELSARKSDEILMLFSKVCRTAALAASVLMCTVALGSPIISWLWLGDVNYTFIYISALMAIMWGFAILSAPAFFLGVATGNVMVNVIGQVIPGLLAPAMVYFLGTAIGPIAAVAGVVLCRIPGDFLPAIFNRPQGRWSHAVIVNPYTFVSICVIVMVSGGTAWLALHNL